MNSATRTIQINEGSRKYSPLWDKIKRERYAAVICKREDTLTVINGVKKEKTRDKRKQENMILECTPTDTGVLFKLVKDTSINNL